MIVGVTLEQAKCAGCKTIFIDRKYKMPMPYKPDFTVNTLNEAEDKILNSKEV